MCVFWDKAFNSVKDFSYFPLESKLSGTDKVSS